MSQVSCGQLLLLDELLDGVIEFVELTAQGGVFLGLFGNDLRQSGTEQSVVGSCAEQDRPPAVVRELVTLRFRNPSDHSRQSQAAEVVGHLAGGEGLGIDSAEGGPVVSQVAIGLCSSFTAASQSPEHQQRREQHQHVGIGEPQNAGPLARNLDRFVQLTKRPVFDQITRTDRAILADALDVQ